MRDISFNSVLITAGKMTPTAAGSLLAAGPLSAIVFPAGARRLLSPGTAPEAAQPGSAG
jgi:hypothetical protein